jgi:hypothetical protein
MCHSRVSGRTPWGRTRRRRGSGGSRTSTTLASSRATCEQHVRRRRTRSSLRGGSRKSGPFRPRPRPPLSPPLPSPPSHTPHSAPAPSDREFRLPLQVIRVSITRPSSPDRRAILRRRHPTGGVAAPFSQLVHKPALRFRSQTKPLSSTPPGSRRVNKTPRSNTRRGTTSRPRLGIG